MATPLLDRLAQGGSLGASEIHAALCELETLDQPGNAAMLRVYTYQRSGGQRVQLVLPSNRFVITDSVEDALLTAHKLLGESSGGSAS
jgi:hypothetical protein